MARVNTKTIYTERHFYMTTNHDCAANLAISVLYSNRVTQADL